MKLFEENTGVRKIGAVKKFYLNFLTAPIVMLTCVHIHRGQPKECKALMPKKGCFKLRFAGVCSAIVKMTIKL